MNEQSGKKSRSRADAESIGPIISRFLAGAGLTQVLARRRIREAWNDAVGPQAASHTRLAGFHNNVLRVEVDSAAFLQELSSFRKDDILKKMRSADEKIAIRDIYFRVASFD